jgi:hypothetical protein
MIDSIDLKLTEREAGKTDFLQAAQYFDIVTGEHRFDNGEYVVSGYIGNVLENSYFETTSSSRGVSIKGGSLCKYHLGNSFQTLTRQETKKAIELLSDLLHLPVDKARVSRFDIAQNIILQNPVEVYYNHLGELKNCKRSPVTDGSGNTEGIYYFGSNTLCCFYNKLNERKKKGQPIPELYQNRNVLRYEQRYKSRLAKTLNVETVTAEMLYSEAFYIEILNRWRDNYFAIKKTNDITLNFGLMKGKKDLYNLGVLALVEMQGGELNLKSQIQEAQKSGKLSKKAAFDLKQAVDAACKEKEGITAKSEAITELDKKIVEAVKYYR